MPVTRSLLSLVPYEIRLSSKPLTNAACSVLIILRRLRRSIITGVGVENASLIICGGAEHP